jgi:hypothetical protein
MANYRQIHTQIWRDNWFLDLEPDEKLLFIYLFSNDNSNLAGLYELHERIIALETGLDRERIIEIVANFEAAGKVYYRDHVVYITNMQKYHSNAGEKVKKHIETIIRGMPEGECKEKYCIANKIELENTPCIPYAYPMDTLSYSKSNNKSNNKSKTEEKYEYESQEKIETPEGGTSTYSENSDKLKSILSHYKTKTGKLDPKDAAMLKDLSVAFSVPDIRDAIDHMVSHTDRPNGSYLRKILEGWYTESKIRKVYK